MGVNISTINYRSEIDGLRALAVLPVIFFHAGFSWFQGGFVGVDVFFVISGYLITTIIISEITAGEFSIVNFYSHSNENIFFRTDGFNLNKNGAKLYSEYIKDVVRQRWAMDLKM